jgi:upstream activation factor subunit UAF30
MPAKKTTKKTVKKGTAKKRTTAKKKPAAKKKTAAKKTTRAKKSTARKTTRKKTAKKAAPKRAAKKTARKPAKKKSTRKPNPAFMRPMQPDGALAAVVGSKPIPRTEITKKLWDYIKKNNLQNPSNKREIMADDKLKPVFGGKSKVNMFQMTKLVSGHIKNS